MEPTGRRRPTRALARRVLPRSLRWWLQDASVDRRIRKSGKLAYPDPPVTFNEKVRYKLLNDRRPLLVQWADKLAVRDYIEAKVGKDYLTELYLVATEPDEVRKEVLPREFAVKPSHGSSACLVVGQHAPTDATLPPPPVGWALIEVTPDSLDWDRLRSVCSEWLRVRFREGLEWAYRHVPPRIIVEELLVDGGTVAADYKFFVFHGRVRLVHVHLDRFHSHTRSFYTPEWRFLPVEQKYPMGSELERPASLSEMLRISEALGEETDFVRVDLYSIGDRIVVGELTSYPNAGEAEFKPNSFDAELGAWWTPPTRYR
jgi:TupA-like ATPgrasp